MRGDRLRSPLARHILNIEFVGYRESEHRLAGILLHWKRIDYPAGYCSSGLYYGGVSKRRMILETPLHFTHYSSIKVCWDTSTVLVEFESGKYLALVLPVLDLYSHF
jgi:hypothetical protein